MMKPTLPTPTPPTSSNKKVLSTPPVSTNKKVLPIGSTNNKKSTKRSPSPHKRTITSTTSSSAAVKNEAYIKNIKKSRPNMLQFRSKSLTNKKSFATSSLTNTTSKKPESLSGIDNPQLLVRDHMIKSENTNNTTKKSLSKTSRNRSADDLLEHQRDHSKNKISNTYDILQNVRDYNNTKNKNKNKNSGILSSSEHSKKSFASSTTSKSSSASFNTDLLIHSSNNNNDHRSTNKKDKQQQQQKHVTFSTATFHLSYSCKDLTTAEKQRTWYTREEFRQIVKRNMQEREMFRRRTMNGSQQQQQQRQKKKRRGSTGSTNDESTNDEDTTNNKDIYELKNCCSRGLEDFSSGSGIIRAKDKKDSISVVLNEQTCQMGDSFYDPEAIAEVYKKKTSSSLSWAINLGARDRKDIEEYLRKKRKSKSPPRLNNNIGSSPRNSKRKTAKTERSQQQQQKQQQQRGQPPRPSRIRKKVHTNPSNIRSRNLITAI